MGVLRRLLGGETDDASRARQPVDQTEIDADERARELELARFEQDRTDDLVRRQQRFSSYSWTPPPQGGAQRAEDADAAEDDR